MVVIAAEGLAGAVAAGHDRDSGREKHEIERIGRRRGDARAARELLLQHVTDRAVGHVRAERVRDRRGADVSPSPDRLPVSAVLHQLVAVPTRGSHHDDTAPTLIYTMMV